jgi:hypothetical protein
MLPEAAAQRIHAFTRQCHAQAHQLFRVVQENLEVLDDLLLAQRKLDGRLAHVLKPLPIDLKIGILGRGKHHDEISLPVHSGESRTRNLRLAPASTSAPATTENTTLVTPAARDNPGVPAARPSTAHMSAVTSATAAQ